MTRNPWALLVPVVAAAGFIFMFIPQLSDYPSSRYGKQYEEWAKQTKRLIPFIC